MQIYELAFLISANLSEEEAKNKQQEIISFLQEKGAILISEIPLARKRLAYAIKKQGQAYLANVVFNLDPEKIAEVDLKLKTDSNILRHLTVTKKKRKVEPVRQRAVPKTAEVAETKEKKVELSEIEKKLEEIL